MGAIAGTIANPLRFLGLTRIVAGGWFAASGVMTLLGLNDLMLQATRLFGDDPGTTDAPIRSLLTLIIAGVLVVVGLVMIAKGIRWTRRVTLPPDGPSPIARDEVIATLSRHDPPAFGAGATQPYWPLRRWLSDQLTDMTWWRREIMSRGVRAFVRTCGLTLLLGVVFLTLRSVSTNDLLGPFPAGFVVVVVFSTAVWAALGMMLIPSSGPRVGSAELPLSALADGGRAIPVGQFVESRPGLLHRESPTLGLTLGIAGIGLQCMVPAWWSLSAVGFPLMTTSIIRHSGSILGGLIFLFVGDRMLGTASAVLRSFRYESTLVFIDDTGPERVVRAAEVRTESLGINGPRHLIAAVADPDIGEMVRRMI